MSEKESQLDDKTIQALAVVKKKFAGRDPFVDTTTTQWDEIDRRRKPWESPQHEIREAYGPDVEPLIIETDASQVARIRAVIQQFIDNFKR